MSASHTVSVTIEEAGLGPFIQSGRAGKHRFTLDEPENLGGQDKGPNPYEALLAALGACTSITLRMYASQKKWPVEKIRVEMTHAKNEQRQDIITRILTVDGPLDETQRARLLEIANKCPVHRTLTENRPVVETVLAP